jgi:hypothetical protein
MGASIASREEGRGGVAFRLVKGTDHEDLSAGNCCGVMIPKPGGGERGPQNALRFGCPARSASRRSGTGWRRPPPSWCSNHWQKTGCGEAFRRPPRQLCR